ncbi:4-hydroxy-tetrahydrodipicolinate synthase [Aquimarina agarilytica]|uniref:4-hydroxy-tetrahydrodipicolinate synthase n=1 Tax=Aquimarina agarilytica TaxID=1087449 RepID=UPI000289D46A|nr:4-hydroxy-tetrahydrodipicolinate synthase [Aquimarina agarilytica]
MSNFLVGTGTALVTPFKKNGAVDLDGLTNLVNYCIDGGVEYLVVLGTTGESVTLSKQEKQEVIDHVVKVNAKRVPLVLGVGGNNTAVVAEEASKVNTTDFQAILSVVPMYNKPSQEGVFQHYTTVANAASLPVLIYNVPGRTGINMTAETTLRLADHKNIIGVKEATGDITQVLKIIKDAPKDFLVISGDDMLALPLVTAGGHGVITVVGQGFPKAFSDMIRLGLKGENKSAYDIHYKMIPVTEYAFDEGNPVGIKAILAAQNVCDATVRLPLIQATSELQQKIDVYVNEF